MNNLVHIPMTPAAQRGEKEKGIERGVRRAGGERDGDGPRRGR